MVRFKWYVYNTNLTFQNPCSHSATKQCWKRLLLKLRTETELEQLFLKPDVGTVWEQCIIN